MLDYCKVFIQDADIKLLEDPRLGDVSVSREVLTHNTRASCGAGELLPMLDYCKVFIQDADIKLSKDPRLGDVSVSREVLTRYTRASCMDLSARSMNRAL